MLTRTVPHLSYTRRKLDQQSEITHSHALNLNHSESNADSDVSENYVSHSLRNTDHKPAVTWRNFWTELNWLNITVLTITPLLSLYGLYSTKLTLKTFLFAFFYGYLNALGVTAGYHRLWAHCSYNASKPLQYILAIFGVGAAEGSIRWWARAHRAHHRYTDTDLDPYGAHHGLLWSHIGWLLIKSRRRPAIDISDLSSNAVVSWQHRWHHLLFLIVAIGFPIAVPGMGWNDWWGGIYFACAGRISVVHHSTFCVNSLAHYLGEARFDDKLTPRDHFLTAFLTMGEGYHNFHHQFPMDYRNGFRWYHWDPTKLFILFCEKLGLATHLRAFPENEINKGMLTMELKKLRRTQDGINWPEDSTTLPIVDWASFQEQSLQRPLVLIAGHIHDISSFLDEHPGGRNILAAYIGKDATTAFFGGVYEHSNAAHNLLAMMRVGVLRGGLELEYEHSVPPSQKLRIFHANELGGLHSSQALLVRTSRNIGVLSQRK